MTAYAPSVALQGALERIKNPPDSYTTDKNGNPVHKKYEHHVSTWACTMLKETFSSDCWAITPEKKDTTTGKKPDFVLEKAILKPPGQGQAHTVDMKLHMCMELKKEGGGRMEDALAQLCDSVLQTLDTKGNTYNNEFEVFAVVQCGLHIGFFEFHSDQTNLDEEDIPHYHGCVSLTHDYDIQGRSAVAVQDKPDDLDLFYYDYKRLRLITDTRSDAKEYPIPCIYHLEKHQKQIHDIFLYMAQNEPRSSWWVLNHLQNQYLLTDKSVELSRRLGWFFLDLVCWSLGLCFVFCVMCFVFCVLCFVFCV